MKNLEQYIYYIYYKINSNEDYYIIEIHDKLKILSTKEINKFLINDGFTRDDINYIKSYKYKYSLEEKEIELKEDVEIQLQDFNKLYLHISINDEMETETNEGINQLDIFQSNITQLKNEIDELSKIDFNKINTENNKKNYNYKMNREMPQMSNFPKIYGLNQNINCEINNIQKNNNELRKSFLRNSYYNNKEEEKILKLYYLYSYPLLDNDNINKKNNPNNNVNGNEMKTEDYIYYEQIYSIYNKFKEKQIHANLNFEPIHINFDFMEKGADIIHFKLNTSKIENGNEKDNNDSLNKFFFNFDINGVLDAYNVHNIHNIIKSNEEGNNAEKIKLLILSTQYINEIKKIFETKNINNIIYIDSQKNEEDENEFIKCLYSNLLDGLSIKESFEKSKEQIKNGKDMVQLISNNDDEKLNLNKLNKGKIELNINCSLNLDYMKCNNHIKVLERNKLLYDCYTKIIRHKNLYVYGTEGVGKKAFVQKVGYFSFEREHFKNVYYLELYSLEEISKKILKYKIEEIKNRNIYDEHDFENKKILIIVYFNFVVKNIEKFEQFINESYKESYKDYYFLYAFTEEKDKIIPLNYVSIQLNKFKNYQEQKLLKYLINSDDEKKIQNIEITDYNMCPNDIYLKALYITLYGDEKDKFKKDKAELIKKVLDYNKSDKINIKKIFCIFCLLKYGISKDFLPFLFSKNTKEYIDFIEDKLKYIIFVEKNEKETIYKMDNSYINLIREKKIFLENEYYKDIYKENIKLIIKKYSLFFRYLVKNSKFPYDISVEFHAGVSNEFWQDNTTFKNDDDNFSEELNEKNKNNEFYFDDVIYTNNVYDLLKNIVSVLKEIKEDIDFKKYISQIAICLPTILHFKKSFLYRDFIINSNIFNFLQDYKKDRIMLLKYWLTGELNDKREDISEFILLKIYKSIKDNKQSEEIRDKYEEYKNKIKDNDKDNVKANSFNLARFYFLFGKITNDKSDYDKAEDQAKKAENLYLELVSKLMKISIDLINNEFEQFDKNFNECENKYKDNKNNISLENSDIEIKLKNIKTLKYELFNNYIKNKLFFFISNPFYDENGKSLKEKETESNNPFFLKYKLSIAFPGLQLEFQNIDYELENLKKCITYPIRFLYIGSDYFNDKGNLFSEDKEFKSCLIENEKIKKIIDESKFKESCEIVILGIGSSGEIHDVLNIFKENKFRHIIYLNLQDMEDKFKTDHVFYCYFQKCFFNFVEDFLFYLSKSGGCLTIKEAYKRANNTFNDNIRFFDNQKILEFGASDVKVIDILGDEKNDNDIYDFGYFNEDNFNPFSSNKKSNIIKINRDLYDGDKDDDLEQNNLYFSKNPFVEFFKNEEKNEKKNYMKYYKFPGQDNLRPENFKKLVNKRIYSMKDILRDLIKLISDKNNKIINIYGNEFRGKTKLCEEVCKHFYMRNYFKKGIFIIDFKLNNRIKDIPELKYHDEKDELLLVFEHIEKINNDLFEWLEKLNVQMIIISKEKISEKIELDNNDKNKKIKNDNEIKEIETIKGNENNIIEPNEKKSSKNINKLILNVFKNKIKFYNIDEESKKYTNNKDFSSNYKNYKRIKYT